MDIDSMAYPKRISALRSRERTLHSRDLDTNQTFSVASDSGKCNILTPFTALGRSRALGIAEKTVRTPNPRGFGGVPVRTPPEESRRLGNSSSSKCRGSVAQRGFLGGGARSCRGQLSQGGQPGSTWTEEFLHHLRFDVIIFDSSLLAR